MNRQDGGNARGSEEPASEGDALAPAVLNAAVKAHRELGPGLFEGVYEQGLCLELALRRIPLVWQPMPCFSLTLVSSGVLAVLSPSRATHGRFLPLDARTHDAREFPTPPRSVAPPLGESRAKAYFVRSTVLSQSIIACAFLAPWKQKASM